MEYALSSYKRASTSSATSAEARVGKSTNLPRRVNCEAIFFYWGSATRAYLHKLPQFLFFLKCPGKTHPSNRSRSATDHYGVKTSTHH